MMHSTLCLSLLLLSSALAFPGPRQVQHHHHVKRDDAIVYATVQVTQYVTRTAGQSAVATPMAADQFGSENEQTSSYTSTPVAQATTLATRIAVSTSAVQHNTPSSTVVSYSSTSARTSSAAAATSSSSGTAKGLGWSTDNPSSMESLFSSSSLNWYFNWGTTATSGLTEEFIYQQWGSSNIGNLASVPTGATVIGFNEPDGTGQATMTAAAAAALYLSNFTPLRKTGQIGYLGTPSITNGGGSAGITWLTEFMSLCSECEIDFVSAHWYGPTMTLFESQMTALNTSFGLPVWVTEFACTNWDVSTNPSASAISTFMSDSIAWMKTQSFIARYAWFGAMVITDTSLGTANSLVTSDGSALSSLGSLYLSL